MRPSMRALLPLCTATLAQLACSGAARQLAPTRAEALPDVVAPIYRASPEGAPLPNAWIAVTIDGMNVDLMVDSGAPRHVLSGSMAWYLGLPRVAIAAELVDATGATMPLLAVTGTVNLAPLGEQRLLVAAMPLVDGVGGSGLFSPQAARRDVAIVDLREGVLRLSDTVPAGLTRAARTCDALGARLYVTTVELAGERLELRVDTGMPHTTIYRDTPIARRLLAAARSDLTLSRVDALIGGDAETDAATEVRAGGLAGSERRARIPNVELRGQLVHAQVDVEIASGRDETCGTSGVLGLDVLGRCKLAFHRDGLDAECTDGPPALRPRPARAPIPSITFTGIDVDGRCGDEPWGARDSTMTVAADEPVVFADRAEAWTGASMLVRRAAERIAEDCEARGGRAPDITIDLALAGDRRTVRGVIRVQPSPR